MREDRMCVVHTEAFPPANIWSICCIISCWAGFVPALGEEAGFSGATPPPTDRGVVGIPPGNPPTSPPGRPPGSPPGAKLGDTKVLGNMFSESVLTEDSGYYPKCLSVCVSICQQRLLRGGRLTIMAGTERLLYLIPFCSSQYHEPILPN